MRNIKLYCVSFKDGDEITDVTHVVASNNKEVHARLDKTLEECAFYSIKEYNTYSFFEVGEVDGFTVNINKSISIS